VATFCPAELTERNGGGIPVVRLRICRLADRDVAYHLRERERVAWAFLPSFRHAVIIAQSGGNRIAVSRCRSFKLTHYPIVVQRVWIFQWGASFDRGGL
jgi:hypothetical protein